VTANEPKMEDPLRNLVDDAKEMRIALDCLMVERLTKHFEDHSELSKSEHDAMRREVAKEVTYSSIDFMVLAAFRELMEEYK